MTQWTVYAVSGLCGFGIGLWGMFAHEHWARKILATNVSASGVFLVLVAMAKRVASGAPDPVPHALVLTGIVVSVSTTALGLALARRLEQARSADSSNERSESPGG